MKIGIFKTEAFNNLFSVHIVYNINIFGIKNYII